MEQYIVVEMLVVGCGKVLWHPIWQQAEQRGQSGKSTEMSRQVNGGNWLCALSPLAYCPRHRHKVGVSPGRYLILTAHEVEIIGFCSRKLSQVFYYVFPKQRCRDPTNYADHTDNCVG